MVRYKYVICIVCFFTLIVFDAWLSEELWHSAQPDSRNVLDAVWEDIVYFPIPESSFDKKGYSVSYTDSFMQSRSYGGAVSYTHLIDAIIRNRKVCHYLDMPIQHSTDAILKRMGRRTNHDDIVAIVQKLRERIPDICIRTTLICGFPGETEELHEELMQLSLIHILCI